MSEPHSVAAGRYFIESVIGGGGMATVYRGIDSVLNRPVAVKLFRPTGIDPAEEERARREAAVLASLDHPGLVTVYDAGVDFGRPFIVMELVEGATLASLISAGPLPPTMVADVGVQVAEALDHVHQRGLVHRDVKPANVLVSEQGDSASRVWLSDFGIARFADAARLTASGLTIGTAAYMAPEQVRGEEVTPAADVYALGLVLLEALTGQREYPGTDVESAAARLHRSPRIPGTVEPGLAGLLTAMTASDPSQRPTSHAVADTLGRARESVAGPTAPLPVPTTVLPVDDRPTAPVGPGRSGSGRRRVLALWLAGGLAVAALVAAGVVLLPGGGTQQPGPGRPAGHTSHSSTAGTTSPRPTPTSPTPTQPTGTVTGPTPPTKPPPPPPHHGPPPKHGKGHGPKKGKGHGHGPKEKGS